MSAQTIDPVDDTTGAYQIGLVEHRLPLAWLRRAHFVRGLSAATIGRQANVTTAEVKARIAELVKLEADVAKVVVPAEADSVQAALIRLRSAAWLRWQVEVLSQRPAQIATALSCRTAIVDRWIRRHGIVDVWLADVGPRTAAPGSAPVTTPSATYAALQAANRDRAARALPVRLAAAQAALADDDARIAAGGYRLPERQRLVLQTRIEHPQAQDEELARIVGVLRATFQSLQQQALAMTKRLRTGQAPPPSGSVVSALKTAERAAERASRALAADDRSRAVGRPLLTQNQRRVALLRVDNPTAMVKDLAAQAGMSPDSFSVALGKGAKAAGVRS